MNIRSALSKKQKMDSEKSMAQAFIKKLNDIIDLNLENEQFGVAELVDLMDKSRTQLHRKLKGLTGKSTSQYIREYRLEKAMEMLQNDVATVSEIAYRVGFSSPTYFNTSFHNFYGYPPGEAKGKSFETKKIVRKTYKKPAYNRIALIGAIPLLIIIVYFIYIAGDKFPSSSSEDLIKDKSIAVLPCKNISGDEENQYFADGIMESIQNHLNRIADLKVISGTTMANYSGTTKTVPEIAEELDVSYLLEASVQQYDNKIRIIAKLIDARNDHQIWSETYDRDLESIFSLQSEIAKKITTELNATLTPSEKERMEYKSTDNLEAYKLYLLGRHLWNKRTHEDFLKSIYYYEKAIEEDPEYGLAYAGLADTYNLMALNILSKERKKWRDKAVDLALRALELDNSLAEAHNVLASIYTYFDWAWEDAEKEYLTAIDLNPNYPTVYHYYSEHLSITGRHKEARENINKALELDPLSFIIHAVSGHLYLHQGLFDEALTENQRGRELINDHPMSDRSGFVINYWLGNDLKAIEALKKIGQLSNEFESFEVDSAYQTSGLNGLYKLRIERTKDTYLQAKLYSMLGENKKALDLLEQLYIDHKLWPEFSFDIHFKSLYPYPRFIALLEKMGLENSHEELMQ